jgi:hypothetical protein
MPVDSAAPASVRPGRRGPLRGLGVCLAALWALPAWAGPIAYEVQLLGLTDAQHTRDDGYRYSDAFGQNGAGQVIGISGRFDGANDTGSSAWQASGGLTVRIGLADSAHTRDDGYQYSDPFDQNEAGQVIGESQRYSGANDAGWSAWQASGGLTSRIGLADAEHTRDDGYQTSNAEQQNQAGQVIGDSRRFDGANGAGWSAWQASGGTSTRIGLADAAHTRDDGYRDSWVEAQNRAGQVIGGSERYSGSASAGESAWQASGGVTARIGLADPTHTRDDGYQRSAAQQQNEAGQVIGDSQRFEGADGAGYSVWQASGGTSMRIGLADAAHTRDDGYQDSVIDDTIDSLNESGQVIGESQRFNGADFAGKSAWQASGGTTARIGLADAEHTRDDGYQIANALGQNEVGQVIGDSARYSGATDIGWSAWQASGGATTRIGLTDALHSRDDGYRDSWVEAQNQAGQAIGGSARYSGPDSAGESAWQASGGVTRRIGVTDGQHTRADGTQLSLAQDQNEAGQVVGYSARYRGTDDAGQTAWLFDAALGTTFAFDLSATSDGDSFSAFEYLGEDGLALGYYVLFDALDQLLGERAFGFTLADGFFDLGELVAGGLDSAGWDFLARAYEANGAGAIVGLGAGLDGSPMAYQLTPSANPAPAPAPWALLLSGLLGRAAARRRTRPRRG